MAHLVAVSLLSLTLSQSGPALAVFGLVPEGGISDSVARLLTDSLTQQMRASNAFGRVISSTEIEALVGFEKTKQIANCDNGSCAAELANALGVDLLCVGNVGRIGSSVLLNLKLLAVNRAATVAAVADRVAGGTEEALLDRIPRATHDLLTEARLVTGPYRPPQNAPEPAPVVAQSLAATSGSSRNLPVVAAGVGLAGLGLALVPLTGAAVAAVAFGGGALTYIAANRVGGLDSRESNVPANLGSVAAGTVAGVVGWGLAAALVGAGVVGGLWGLGADGLDLGRALGSVLLAMAGVLAVPAGVLVATVAALTTSALAFVVSNSVLGGGIAESNQRATATGGVSAALVTGAALLLGAGLLGAGAVLAFLAQA